MRALPISAKRVNWVQFDGTNFNEVLEVIARPYTKIKAVTSHFLQGDDYTQRLVEAEIFLSKPGAYMVARTLKEGQVVVNDGGEIQILTAHDFDTKYRSFRKNDA
jgi:hypothetical protein